MEAEELLGALPQNWEYTTLGEVCARAGGDIQTGPFGSQLHASDYIPEGIPSIMPQNIGDNRIVEEGIARISRVDAERLSRYRVTHGDIVYSRRGDVEKRALVRRRESGWLCGTGCLRIRFGGEIVDPEYASYYLGHPSVREWVVRHAHGATMPNLNTSILSALPFVIPPKPMQRAIAHILGTLDSKIELNRRMNETLEAMARALFKSWFVYFDPVRAKAEGRDTGLPEPLRELFPDSCEDSELGAIPKGWRIGKFADTIDILGGGTPKTSVTEYWNGAIPWFSVADAPGGADVWVIDTEKKITRVGVENSSTQILPKGATIITARGTVGRIALVGVPMAMNQSCYGLRGKADIHGYYTYFATRQLVSSLQQRAHGSVFDTITRDTFGGVTVVVPPPPLIEGFEKAAGPTMERIRAGLLDCCTLATLRDLLLPKLMAGELRIQDAQRSVEALS
jgi:type I restriction enzyme S subunit